MGFILVIHPNVQNQRKPLQTRGHCGHEPGGQAVGIDPDGQGPISWRSFKITRFSQLRFQLRHLMVMLDQPLAGRGRPRRCGTGQQDLADLVTTLKDPRGPIMTTLSNLESTSGHLARVMGKIDRGEGLLGSLVTSRELLDRVLLNLDKVDFVLDDIQSASAQGAGIMDQISGNLTTVQTVGSGLAENVQVLKAILTDARLSLETIQVILDNLKKGSQDVPRVTNTAKAGIREIREGVEDIDRVVQSLQRNIFIRSNLPKETMSMNTDAGIRP